MVNYKDLGLVNSREMFKKAMEGKYAIPAFNFNNMEQMQAIVAACVETKSPVILQVSSGAIFQFVFTSTMATRTNCAYLVSKWDSLLS